MKRVQLADKYVALFRGINVGGHHKVPMEILKQELEKTGFTKIITLLNSGNVIFETVKPVNDKLAETIAEVLEKRFGFPVPVILRKAEEIIEIQNIDTFKNIEVTKDIRLYVSFLKQNPDIQIDLPWISEDKTFRILDIKTKTVFSVLELSITSSPKGMEALEKFFGQEITTRNWNTIIKIISKF